ncbi:uncharacterized protein isoform X2 [Rhodnius prolixus]|uniref:Uncharacterized protein n=1 Tax=Rhodnius prolixus TaxID=13249 RepID=T1HGT4_RHOPR
MCALPSEERSKQLLTISELQQLVVDKESDLRAIQVKLKATIDEKEELRSKMNEIKKQMEELANEIKRIPLLEAADASTSNMPQLLGRQESVSDYNVLSAGTMSEQLNRTDDLSADSEDARRQQT